MSHSAHSNKKITTTAAVHLFLYFSFFFIIIKFIFIQCHNRHCWVPDRICILFHTHTHIQDKHEHSHISYSITYTFIVCVDARRCSYKRSTICKPGKNTRRVRDGDGGGGVG